MGKNVYAAPRKGPAGKWVEQSGDKPVMKDQQKAKQERIKEAEERAMLARLLEKYGTTQEAKKDD